MLTDHEHHVTNETHTISLMYLPKFGLSSLLGKPTSGHPTLCFLHQPLMHTVGIRAYASCTICFQPVCCSWSFLGPFIRALFFFLIGYFFFLSVAQNHLYFNSLHSRSPICTVQFSACGLWPLFTNNSDGNNSSSQ